MSSAKTPDDDVPPDIAYEIAQATAALRADHKQQATRLQRVVDKVTAFVGSAAFVAGLAAGILLWVLVNLGLRHFGLPAFDPPPFTWLEGAVSIASLFVALSILATQRREDELEGHHIQLILELSILNDRKISKIIGLIEEMRRDTPAIKDRVDGESELMATPADAHAVLKAIKDVAEEVGV